MKKALKITGYALGGLLVLLALFLLSVQLRGIPEHEPPQVDLKVEVTPQRVQQGAKIASMLCNNCHADNNRQLTGKKLEDIPTMFGTFYSANITQDSIAGIGRWTDGQIYAMLRTQIRPDHSYNAFMPNFPLMADEDIYSIIAYLHSDDPAVQPSRSEGPKSQASLFAKFLTQYVLSPDPLPAHPVPLPDTTNAVERGRYLANAQLGCYHCHSGDLIKVDGMVPENSFGFYQGGSKLRDIDGNDILSANLTPDMETGIGKYTAEEFIQAVKYGKRRDGTMLRYPMTPHTALTDEEAKAIYAYLRTLPPSKATPNP